MKKHLLIMTFVFLLPALLWAQEKITVKGTVSDGSGSTIPGVSILVKGTATGVATDIEGNYILPNVDPNAVLVFSFIGYKPQEVALNGRTELNVVLKENTEMLDEVVVTGYGGTQLRSKLTSAITTVGEKEIKSGIKSNPLAALAGTVSGLVVQQNSGKPGATPSVVLRGGTSLSGSGSPLYVIDGIVRTANDFNPEDIESMEVLKDASATSIYGARANNGVILITTKKGKKGRAEITFKAKTGLSYMNRLPKFLNAGDYLYWLRTGFKNAAASGHKTPASWMGMLKQANGFGTGNLLTDPVTGKVLDGNLDGRAIYSPMILSDANRHKLNEGWKTMIDPVYGDEIIYKEFDFTNEAFRDAAVTQDYNVSVSGGGDKASYYAGIGYYDEKGFPVNTWYKRFNFTFNAEYKVNNWITSSSGFNFADAKWRDQAHTTDAVYFNRMLSLPPTMRGYNEDGELLMGVHYVDGNPNFSADKFIRKNNSDKFSMSQAFTFNLPWNVYIKFSGNLFYSESLSESMNKDFMMRPGQWDRTRSTSVSFNRDISQTYNVIGGWKQAIGKHSFDVLAGFEFYDLKKFSLSASGREAPTDDFMDLGLTTSAEGKRGIDSGHSRERIMSAFGRLNYDYANKYLLTFTFREDGYSRLRDNRWGFFPGVSVGWNILEEDFMEGTRGILSFLKVRAGYGQNGNVNSDFIKEYTLQGSYSTTSKYEGELGYLLGSLPLPAIRWEKSSTFDAAVDVSFLENKYNLSVGFFNRETDDLLANVSLPGSSGYKTVLTNNGSVRNRGVELEVKINAINTKDWTWTIGANATYIRSIITKLPNNGNKNNRQNGQQVYDLKTGEKVWVGGYQEGQRAGAMYGYIAEGLYRSQEEVMASPIRQDVTTYYGDLYRPDEYAKLSAAEQSNNYVMAPGDVKWKDMNGDGIIDVYDQAYLGNSNPKWTGGINTNVSWKGLSLYARMDFALGHTIYDNIRPGLMGLAQGEFNTITDVKNSWTPENPNARYPRIDRADALVKANYSRRSSMFAKDGSYLCFRDVTLSYDLPKDLLAKASIKAVTFSVTGQNLGYWKASNVFTPEGRGVADSGYPLPTTVVFGAQLTF